MTTLSEFQAAVDTGNEAAKAAANEAVANYFFITNVERQSLYSKSGEAQSDLDVVLTDPNGIDEANVMKLQKLLTHIEVRKKVLQARVNSFLDSALSISPPSPQVIATVKDLSQRVSAIQAKAKFANSVKTLLVELAEAVNSV